MSAARAITCPQCGGAIAIKAAGYTVSVGCQHCGALLDVAHPDVTVIAAYEDAMRGLPVPLGRRGTLFGDEWEAIGALSRHDYDVEWTETLLFNPYLGYRWLVLSEGEWSLGTMITDPPQGSGEDIEWRGEAFHQDYNLAETITSHVVGEFYWRVAAGDTVAATTYSRRDTLLSAEWSGDEGSWTQLVPVSAQDVRQAFGLSGVDVGDSPAPRRKARPLGLSRSAGAEAGDNFMTRLRADYDAADIMEKSDLPKMFKMGVAAFLISLLMMMGFTTSSDTVNNYGRVKVGGPEVTVNVGQISLNAPYQPVEIDAFGTGFENAWVDINYTLINRKTQRGYTAYGVIERYTGRDSEGPWSEGSFYATTQFSGIPRGTYDVVADLKANRWNGGAALNTTPTWDGSQEFSVNLTATSGGFMWGNLWLIAALLLGMPILIFWMRHS